MIVRKLQDNNQLSLSSFQAWSFLSHLPVLEVGLSVKGWWQESHEQTERPLPAAGANLREESSWLDVHADQEYVLQVSLRRITLGQQRVSEFTSRFFFPPSHLYVASSMRVGSHREIDPKALAVTGDGNKPKCKSESQSVSR